ncbi:hypothetical protein BX616_006925, partial [Lobosporangium transversale]
MQGTRTIDDDRILVMELCLDADSVLSRIQKPWKKSLTSTTSASSTSSTSNEDMALRQGIGLAYYELARLLEQSSSSKLSKMMETVQFTPVQTIATISKDIFNHNEPPAVIRHNLPDIDASLDDIYQLAYCLSLLPTAPIQTNELNNYEKEWQHAKSSNQDEQNRLRKLASDVIELFISDGAKTEATIAEVVTLVPVLNQTQFRTLLMSMVNGISQNIVLETHLLEGLTQLIQHAPLGYLDSDDLVKILNTLSSRLQGTHSQSRDHLYRLSATVSHVLDAMVDSQVKDLKREQLHEPLGAYLKGPKDSLDPHLVYQSAYAFQAL